MKLNKTKLKNQTLYLTSDEIKNEAEFIEAMKNCIEKVKRGQADRIGNSLGESWELRIWKNLLIA
ncbi:hypothetical protein IJG72_06505 [bacterium]|nr:hypothetical protein [bacterium]